MNVDFDRLTNNLNIDSIRWDTYKGKDILPLWVADMDFQSPPCVVEALNARVRKGIYGYTHTPDSFNQVISHYLYEHYQWEVDPDWIIVLPSVVSGLYTAVQQLTKENEGVLVPNPIYHHLRLACTEAKRNLIEMSLQLVENRWVLPGRELPEIINSNTKLALFCNPQNPGSTVFTREELRAFGELCVQKDLWICSDEIHAGLVLEEGKKHIPLASISKEISERTITLMSLNKTFNFPGIGLAWAVAENPALRKAIKTGLHQTIAGPSLLAYTASIAAIAEGEPWRLQLVEYLRKNRNLITSKIEAIDSLSIGKLEGSYLAWIDCTNLQHPNPHKLFLDAGLALSPGSQFGNPQFVRLNFGTQKTRLLMALDIIEKVGHTKRLQ